MTTLDALRSTGALVQTLALIITLIVLAVGSPQGWVVLLCLVLLGAQPQALFMLLHEAAHSRRFANCTPNDGTGR